MSERGAIGEPRRMVSAFDPAADELGLLDLYISLKAKPIALLRGPAGSGKLVACRYLARELTVGAPLAFQEMIGHAWSAAGSPGIALLTEAQSRFNAEKLRALVEEARDRQNHKHVYVALLARISPAELDLLSELASETHRGGSHSMDDRNPGRPQLLPRNVLLLATLDGVGRNRWDTDLMACASIITWPGRRGDESSTRVGRSITRLNEVDFVRSAIRHPKPALRRLRRFNGWHTASLRPLYATWRILEAYGLPETRRTLGEALIYIANAWMPDGSGIFDRSFPGNIWRALDFALVSTVLPRLEAWDGPVDKVADDLAPVLRHRYLRMARSLDWLVDASGVSRYTVQVAMT